MKATITSTHCSYQACKNSRATARVVSHQYFKFRPWPDDHNLRPLDLIITVIHSHTVPQLYGVWSGNKDSE